MELSEENLNGRIFNRWKVIGFHERRKHAKYYWCECLDCHEIKSVYISNVIRGQSKSCGCISHRETAYNINKKENEIKIDGNIAYIKIESPVEGTMLCDVEDLPKLENLYIRIRESHGSQYAIAMKDRCPRSIHRIIMGINNPKIQVDHINGNGLDNRKNNLRLCNSAENNRNKLKPNKNNTSGYRGISYDKTRNKWRGYIGFNGKTYRKRFDTPELAYEWYVDMNKKLYGEFSPYNTISV